MKCEHTFPDGRQCKAWAVGGGSLCNAHNGVLVAHASKAALVGAEKRRKARESVEREQILATMGLDARLRVEAGKREGELIKALLDLALIDKDRQALLAVFDRLEGRSVARVQTEQVGDTSELDGLSMEELRKIAGGGLRVIPGGIPSSRMDTGDAASK